MPDTDGRPPRTAGFRFFWSDGVFLAVLAAMGWWLREPLGPQLGIIPFAAGHFFLFCNVFRVRRSYELCWTAVALVNAGAWLALTPAVNWWAVMAVQTPVTLLVIALEMRSPRYHGIGAARLNAAHLPAWLAGELD